MRERAAELLSTCQDGAGAVPGAESTAAAIRFPYRKGLGEWPAARSASAAILVGHQ